MCSIGKNVSQTCKSHVGNAPFRPECATLSPSHTAKAGKPYRNDVTQTDLRRFRSGLLKAMIAIRQTGYRRETPRRVQAGCGSHHTHQCPDMAQVASDLGIGLSAPGKWVRAVSEVAKVPALDGKILCENERPRKVERHLRVSHHADQQPSKPPDGCDRARAPCLEAPVARPCSASTALATCAGSNRLSAGNHRRPSNKGSPNMST